MSLPTKTLANLRLMARRFSDMLNSDFVTDLEVNDYINLGFRELYDLFFEAHGHEYFLKAVEISLAPPKVVYELPSDVVGVKGVDWSTDPMPASSKSVVAGTFPSQVTTTTQIDVPFNESDNIVELEPYDFFARNEGSNLFRDTRYGGRLGRIPPQYRILSSNKTVTVSSLEGSTVVNSQVNLLRLNDAVDGYLYVWYWPEVPILTDDTDSFPFFHGFEEFPSLVAAIMMLAKEESDTTELKSRLNRLKERISTMAASRAVAPERIQDTERY